MEIKENTKIKIKDLSTLKRSVLEADYLYNLTKGEPTIFKFTTNFDSKNDVFIYSDGYIRHLIATSDEEFIKSLSEGFTSKVKIGLENSIKDIKNFISILLEESGIFLDIENVEIIGPALGGKRETIHKYCEVNYQDKSYYSVCFYLDNLVLSGYRYVRKYGSLSLNAKAIKVKEIVDMDIKVNINSYDADFITESNLNSTLYLYLKNGEIIELNLSGFRSSYTLDILIYMKNMIFVRRAVNS